MADLKSFGKRIKIVGQTVEDNATKLVRKVAIAVDGHLVLSTPVDTGRARSNWQVEINAEAGGTVEPVSPQQAMAQAAAKVATSRNGDEIHITNNLPYIGKLNDGWSAQAPASFVQIAVLEGVQVIKGTRLLVKSGDRVIGGDLGRIG